MSESNLEELEASMQDLVESYRRSVNAVSLDELPSNRVVVWMLPILAAIVDTQLDMIAEFSKDQHTRQRLALSAMQSIKMIGALQEALGKDNG